MARKTGFAALVAAICIVAAVPGTANSAEASTSDKFAQFVSYQVQQTIVVPPGATITIFYSADELKALCKDGGWQAAGLENQGQRVSAVEVFLKEGLTVVLTGPPA